VLNQREISRLTAENSAPTTSNVFSTAFVLRGTNDALMGIRGVVMTSAFSKILVATDFGAESEAALKTAGTLARDLGASIHLLNVVRDPLLAVNTPDLYGIDWDQLRETVLDDSRRELQHAAASIPNSPVTCDVRFGRPAEAIAETAQEIGADLIVMGTHGRGAVGHFFIGSVAERVIRLASCPVITVRGSGAVRVAAGEGAVAGRAPASHAAV
jgi:nucleotide-binding universal stress UspA family protein